MQSHIQSLVVLHTDMSIYTDMSIHTVQIASNKFKSQLET